MYSTDRHRHRVGTTAPRPMGINPSPIVLAAGVSRLPATTALTQRHVSAPNTDDDTVGVTLSTTAVTVTEASGNSNTDTYTVVTQHPADWHRHRHPHQRRYIRRGHRIPGLPDVYQRHWNTAQSVTVTGVGRQHRVPIAAPPSPIQPLAADYGSVSHSRCQCYPDR